MRAPHHASILRVLVRKVLVNMPFLRNLLGFKIHECRSCPSDLRLAREKPQSTCRMRVAPDELSSICEDLKAEMIIIAKRALSALKKNYDGFHYEGGASASTPEESKNRRIF